MEKTRLKKTRNYGSVEKFYASAKTFSTHYVTSSKMKTFRQYIQEANESFDLDKFKKDCDFFLTKLKGTHGKDLLYHGTRDLPNGDFEIRQFKERTGPKDSTKYTHNQLNKMFTEKFGVKPRNWLFVTGDLISTFNYGIDKRGVLVIFPIGKFNWVCGLDDDLRDLFKLHKKIWVKPDPRLSATKRNNLATDIMIDEIKNMNWVYNEKIIDCINSYNEIHIECEKFYAFKYTSTTFNEIVKPFLETL
jgi:hypothetical protein